MQSQISSICISYLTQLLDLNALDELLDVERESFVLTNIRSEFGSRSCEDDILDADRREKKSHKKLFKSNSKECQQVFGGRLSESSVKVIIKIIDHLKNHTEIEGLFRVSGNKRRQEDLKEVLNRGQPVDLSDRTYSQHDIATILKQFFAELTEPLLTNSLYACYKQVAEMDGTVSAKKRLKALQLLSLLLPPLNRLLFKKLVELLHLVSQKTINLMTSKNLAVVFAPNIAAKTKISCLSDYGDLEPLTSIFEFLIENATEVFKVPDEIFDPRQESWTSSEDGVLKTPKVYCQQLDIKNYHTETVKCTNDALAELYNQVMNMPDSNPMKKSFLDDFRKKYPGTPPFTPQCRKLQSITGSPSVPRTTPLKRRMIEDFKSSENKDDFFEKEEAHFLSTPEKKRLFTEGDLADHMTPEALDIDHSKDVPTVELVKEKRKRFRRPSFGRPSLGFLSKRSTPDLRKLRKTPSSKRARSNSSTDAPEGVPKRGLPFTPFSDRRSSTQRAGTDRRLSKRSNRVSISDSDVRPSIECSGQLDADDPDHFQRLKDSDNSKVDSSKKTPRAKPELRAPLMNIKSISKPMMPLFSNPRRETLAVNKEQIVTIDAYRPRRETLAVSRDSPAIIPLKPRRENFSFEKKGEPILESFKPKRDSLLIHKKIQPQREKVQCVKKQIYSDIDNVDSCVKSATEPQKDLNPKVNKESGPWHRHRRQMDQAIHRRREDQAIERRQHEEVIEFKTFGKSSIAPLSPMKTAQDPFHHARRMSTGSIANNALSKIRSWDDGYMVTYL